MGTPTMHYQQHIEAALKMEFGTLHYAPEKEKPKKRGRSHFAFFVGPFHFMFCFDALL
jgi:hypothetical protein